MKRSRHTLLFTAGTGMVAFALWGALYQTDTSGIALAAESTTDNLQMPHCVSAIERRKVNGQSMHGLVEDGESLQVLRGYYDCRPVEREDWVVFSYSGVLGKDLALLKIAFGLPGDKVKIVQSGADRYLHINDQPVIAPSGQPYQLSKTGASYISLALQGKNTGIIPRGRYLVLGTTVKDGKDSRSSNGWDSRRFGFVVRHHLLGKATKIPLETTQ